MNNFKPLLISLLLCSSLSTLALADNVQLPTNLGFAGVGIGSNQYLGVYLANPPVPVKTSAIKHSEIPVPTTVPDCNVELMVSDIAGNPVDPIIEPLTVSPGKTVFKKVVEATAVAPVSSEQPPEYFKVNIKMASAPVIVPTPPASMGSPSKSSTGCKGVTVSLGVYDKLTHDLLVALPTPPIPQK